MTIRHTLPTPSMPVSKRRRTELHNSLPSITYASPRIYSPKSSTISRARSKRPSPLMQSHAMHRRDVHRLPPEIIAQCLEGLDKQHLFVTSLINHDWSNISCELLYTDVYLNSSAPNVGSTIRLLEQAKATKFVNLNKIKTAVVETCAAAHGSAAGWIPVNFFEGWGGLTVLELNGMPFDNVWEMRALSDCITRSCPNLTTLAVRPSYNSLPIVPHLHIRAPRLTPIALQYNSEFSSIDIGSLLNPLQSKLTHLHFFGSLDYNACTTLDNMLAHITFPSLISFQLCPINCDNNNLHISNQLLAQFLSRHPRLQHLSMGRPTRISRVPPSVLAVDASQVVERGPKLRSLAVYFGKPGSGRVESTICRLEEMDEVIRRSNASHSNDYSLRPMFWYSQEFVESPFHETQYVKMEFDDERSHRRETNLRWLDAEKAIIRVKDLCPNVVILELELVCNLDNLAENVLNSPPLEQLECLIVSRLSVLSPNENESLNQQQKIVLMEKIAAACPRLKYVVMKKPVYTTLPDCVFTLNRHLAMEESWPNFTQRLHTVDQQFMDDGLEYLRRFGISGMMYAESV